MKRMRWYDYTAVCLAFVILGLMATPSGLLGILSWLGKMCMHTGFCHGYLHTAWTPISAAGVLLINPIRKLR